jgi:hypothetical protein
MRADVIRSCACYARVQSTTTSASGLSRVSAAKAASISRLVLALSTWIWSAVTAAAACASPSTASTRAGSAGLTRTATREVLGTSSCSSANRFATNSAVKKLIVSQVVLLARMEN